MPRMRTLKPEACTSESLADVDRGVRWTFSTFWTHCDDEGRAVWNLRLIKAAIYPLDDTITPDVLAGDFAELERVGAVCRYEVGGRQLVHVPSWAEHQHPNRKVDSKLPPCPKTDHSVTPHAQRTEPAVNAPPQSSPVVVVVGGDVGEKETETGRVSAATALAVITDASSTQTIVAEWIDHCDKRPPNNVIGQTSKGIAAMLAEGIDPDDVRRGVAAWMAKGLHPSTLPSVVNEVMNSGRRSSRAQDETDAMFERAARRLGVAQ